jgi:protein SCO1/2
MPRTPRPIDSRRRPGSADGSSGQGASVVVRAAIVLAGLLLLWVSLFGQAARASTGEQQSEHHHHMAPETVRTLADYSIPRIALVREDGKNVVLTNEIDDGKPVVLSFVYTTCTTICPLTSMTLEELQGRLGDARDRVHLVSISIDPEQDTPARLREYARKFNAGPEWHHYTGTVGASVASQRAFDVYRGDKMSHAPVTLVRAGPNERWVRFEGFATADQLLAELRHAADAR